MPGTDFTIDPGSRPARTAHRDRSRWLRWQRWLASRLNKRAVPPESLAAPFGALGASAFAN
jgi:hypothetical protein